jgi:hypothetical protein
LTGRVWQKKERGEKGKGNKERHQVFVVKICGQYFTPKKKMKKKNQKKAGDQTQSLVNSNY